MHSAKYMHSYWLTLIAALLVACPVNAQSISFDQICKKAETQSFDLKLSAVDADLAANKVREARVAYLPTINASASTEFVGAFGNNSPQQQSPVVVGATILPGLQRFQNAMAITANHTINDFGARANQLKAAKLHAKGMEIQKQVGLRDLRLSLLDTYSTALSTFCELQYKKHQSKLQDQLYEIKTRMQQAGRISRIDLGEQAIARATAQKEVQDLQVRLADLLNKLSAFTHDPYNYETVQLEKLETQHFQITEKSFSYPWLADYKAYEALIKEKHAEKAALLAQRFPQISFFGSFVFYGASTNSYGSSFSNLSILLRYHSESTGSQFQTACRSERKRSGSGTPTCPERQKALGGAQRF